MFTFDDKLFSDFHKDAYGFRPRNHEYYSATPERKQEIWDQTGAAMQRAIDEEREQQAHMVTVLEKRIADTIALGAGNEETALRWILQADGIEDEELAFYGASYLCYHFGVPYSMGDRFEKLVRAAKQAA